MGTVTMPMYEWKAIPWKQVERKVFKLQKRIYRASSRGDTKAVHKLQRLLMKSRAAALLAVRRVTQDNQGKKTAGVDGVKSLTPPQRLELTQQLQQNPYPDQAKPVRRVWIPKPGSTEKRGLGIPVMKDRAAQALAKLALEAEWEAKFEPNSYGFRPGRSAHDAIAQIYQAIRHKPKYVLDADIAKCFDRIEHAALLEKLQTYPRLRRVIKTWLKAGVMEGTALTPTTEGSPQGGIISPLLANAALHGLETTIMQKFTRKTHKENHHPTHPIVVRYADDFAIFDESLETIQAIQLEVSQWLKALGLELKPSKTRITHTLVPYEGQVGFDFLGFEIRQYKAGKTHSDHNTHGQLLGFKTIIKPSKEKVKLHLQKIGAVIDRHKAAPQASLITQLNPLTRGWSNYYSTAVSSRIFSRCDNLTYQKLQAWARRRHPNKGKKWVALKYWHVKEAKGWHFKSGEQELYLHRSTKIKRHIKVQASRSPFDGDWIYWATRMGRHPEVGKTTAMLLKQQAGKCRFCGLYFKDGDLLEKDHRIPLATGGKDMVTNLQLLHRHCHDTKTAQERKAEPGEVLV